MKIEAFILCYNEEKMIRHTLNHYSKFCSSIYVIDNESTDNTVSIIRNEYPHVQVITYSSGGELCDDKHLSYKNNIWKKSTADYVIVCDCDELLWHPELLTQLQKLKQKQITFPSIEGYNMFSPVFPETYSSPIIDQVNQGVRAYNFDKQIIFDPSAIAEINYSPGAHKCVPTYNKFTNPEIPDHPLYLLHYKYLSEQYLIDKHHAYAGRLSEFNKENGYGAEYLKGEKHVKECFELIVKSGKLLDVINNSSLKY